MQSNLPSLYRVARQLEARRRRPLVVFGATRFDHSFLPRIAECLTQVGRVDELDVLLYTKGGAVTAARSIGKLFHRFAKHVSFIAPSYCQSAGTLLALAGHEIIGGVLTLFSPCDPHLESSGGEQVGSMSSEDLRCLPMALSGWFEFDAAAAAQTASELVSASIFPSTIASLYRCEREVVRIGAELLGLHGNLDADPGEIITTLVRGYPSHFFPLHVEDLAALGLPVTAVAPDDVLFLELARALSGRIGAESVRSTDDPWHDAVVGTTSELHIRRRTVDLPDGAGWSPLEDSVE